MPFHAIIEIEGREEVVGTYPSETEAFVMARRAWDAWIDEFFDDEEDRLYWGKAGDELEGFGPKTSQA